MNIKHYVLSPGRKIVFWLRVKFRPLKRKIKPVDYGNLRRLHPIGRSFGFDRGSRAVGRYYVDTFLSSHASDIRGVVLEIGIDRYTRELGADRVTKSEVLHYVEGNPKATIVADLTCADQIPSNNFDCIIFTQTLRCIYDVRAAVKHLYRILKPGGVLLVTTCGIAMISRHEGLDPWGEYWFFTDQSARHLFEEFFPAENVEVKTYGNVLAALAYLHGLAAEELTMNELQYHDKNYQVIVAVRAVKPTLISE